MANGVTNYMVDNGYINISLQKGGISDFARFVENTSVISQLMPFAKSGKKKMYGYTDKHIRSSTKQIDRDEVQTFDMTKRNVVVFPRCLFWYPMRLSGFVLIFRLSLLSYSVWGLLNNNLVLDNMIYLLDVRCNGGVNWLVVF